MKIKKGDTVVVISGDEAATAPRTVTEVLEGGQKVVVEASNVVQRHVKRGIRRAHKVDDCVSRRPFRLRTSCSTAELARSPCESVSGCCRTVPKSVSAGLQCLGGKSQSRSEVIQPHKSARLRFGIGGPQGNCVSCVLVFSTVIATKSCPSSQKEYGTAKPHALPQIKKIVVSMGVGRAIGDQKILQEVAGHLGQITGQKPALTTAKKSVSNFSCVRECKWLPSHTAWGSDV